MATGENIGMMEGAFFVGRKAILDWLNELLKTNLTKIEETCSGAIACQLCDALYGPESRKVPMHKVKWDCKADFEYTQNYKILQDVFQKVGVNKVIPVAQLIRGKYQDNLEFMQWFKRFFELNYSGMPEDYDAIKRRAKGKGVATFDKRMASKPKSKPRRGHGSSATSRRPTRTAGSRVNSNNSKRSSTGNSDKSNNNNNNNNGTSSRSGNSRSSTGRSSNNGSDRTTTKGRPQQKENRRTNTHSNNKRSSAMNAQLVAKNEELTSENTTLLTTVTGLEKERDFYFGKLRDVEILIQNLTENDTEPTKEVKGLCDSILKILYATEEDFTTGGGGDDDDDDAEEEEEVAAVVEENNGASQKVQMKDDDDIATTNVNVESKMEVTAPVVKSPTPLPGPTQNVNETKVVEQEDDEGLGLDEGVETF